MIIISPKLKKFADEIHQSVSPSMQILLLLDFLHCMIRSMITFLGIFLTTEYSLSPNKMGLVMGLFGISLIAGSITSGKACNFFGFRQVMIISIVISLFSLLVFSFSLHLWLVFLAVEFLGFSIGFYRPASDVAILKAAEFSRRRYLCTVRRTVTNISFALYFALAGLLLTINLHLIFLITAAISLSLLLILIYQWKLLEGNDYVDQLIDAKKVDDQFNHISKGQFICLCFTIGICCICLFQLSTSYPIYLKNNTRLPINDFAFFCMVNTIMVVLGEIGLNKALRRLDSQTLVLFGAMLLCGGFAILPWGKDWQWFFYSCIIFTFGEMLLFSNAMTLVMRFADAGNSAHVMSIYEAAFSTTSILAPVVGTYIYSISPDWVWYMCGVLGLSATLIMSYSIMFLSRRKYGLIIWSKKN